MKKILITLCIAVIGTAAMAQDREAMMHEGVSEACLMATDANAMKTLGLSAEQQKTVADLQSMCKQHQAEMKENEGMDDATMDTHNEKLQAVLTKEQYVNWVAWCEDREVE